jgi:trehalose 6-phosphate synthase
LARLVIVSNRVPEPTSRAQRSGGLAVALSEALRGEVLWFGWSGRTSAEPQAEPNIVQKSNITYATVDLSEGDYRSFYVGFANSSLWPLLHYRLGLMEFKRPAYRGYSEVNEKFAAALKPLLRDKDHVWIHDYHLIPLAAALRRSGVGQPLGFFLHIPFPPHAVFEALPCAAELVAGLLAHDVVGFQTARDRQHFLGCVATMAQGVIDDEFTVRTRGHVCRVLTVPAGIDADQFARTAKTAAQSKEAKRMRESLVNRKLIIGADRLDYSKGLIDRFKAYSLLFDRYPEHKLKVSYLQVAPRSREDVAEYRDLKRDLDRRTGNINGRFAEFDWVPLRYMTRDVSRKHLSGFYRIAAIGLVTPLRDGMNLVAKEYVAAQDAADPGVLVLSRFAGAAERLEGALIVNPFDADEVAEAIHSGLIMPLNEREARWKILFAGVKADSAAAWSKTFVSALKEVAVPSNGSAAKAS